MNRPNKKAIREAVDKLKQQPEGTQTPDYQMPKLEGKKANKNRIRRIGT